MADNKWVTGVIIVSLLIRVIVITPLMTGTFHLVSVTPILMTTLPKTNMYTPNDGL